MENLSIIPESEKGNYVTLNKDIGMVQMSNNTWDLWFENGDLVSATEFHSLQVGIIIACLTSWNYMNRYGNPTYEIFGNQSYTLLKENKTYMVKYKIEQYFLECLNRMRRVYEVKNLKVYDLETHPYEFLVEFKVLSINNELVDGSFVISTDFGKSASFIVFSYNQPYCSLENPLEIHLQLLSEYGNGLANEALYVYINDECIGVYGQTDKFGRINFNIYPNDIDYDATIRFEFKGNTLFNGCVSDTLTFTMIPFHFNVDENDMLYVTTVMGEDIKNYIWLGEIVDTYNNIPNEPSDWKKLYITKDTKKAYKITEDGLTLKYSNVELKTPNQVGEYHLFIEDGEGLYMLESTNYHVYYIGG